MWVGFWFNNSKKNFFFTQSFCFSNLWCKVALKNNRESFLYYYYSINLNINHKQKKQNCRNRVMTINFPNFATGCSIDYDNIILTFLLQSLKNCYKTFMNCKQKSKPYRNWRNFFLRKNIFILSEQKRQLTSS